MTNPDPLLRLIRVLEDELRLPVDERPSGATDDGLRSAIADAQQAVLEVVYDLTDHVMAAMKHTPVTDDRGWWSQVTLDGRDGPEKDA